jgi:predicted metal-dependent hydrolase
MFNFQILKRVKIKQKASKKIRKNTKYLAYKEEARKLVTEKLKLYQKFYESNGIELKYNRVAIRDQKSRWGSCSSKANLNFNYRLALIPTHLLDYVVVHELCHLKEMNHAKSFWGLVSLAVPDYIALKEKLRLINLRKL